MNEQPISPIPPAGSPSPPASSTRATSASPRELVRREVRRALLGFLVAPLRMASYWVRRGTHRAGVRRDLGHAAEVASVDLERLFVRLRQQGRPLRIFVSCAEASGESHAVGIVRALRALATEAGAPAPRITGLGGSLLAEEAVEIIGNPVERAAMGTDAIRSISFYTELLENTAQHFLDVVPDVVVPVDSPALHVPLGHIARACALPVVHYVTPQYWAWAPWRVGGYRAAVDLGLTILPFEESWFARHGITTAHVGHPQLDIVRAAACKNADEERTTLVLLPGSRRGVIEKNLPWMLMAAARLRLTHPDLQVVLPHDRPELTAYLEEHLERGGAASWARLAMGDLHGSLARARIAISVSGTILLDLLQHRVPTAVIYRARTRFMPVFARALLTVPWFSSVNLLAGREVLPEFSFRGEGPLEEITAYLQRSLEDASFRGEVVRGLDQAQERLGPPGAALRAAEQVLGFALEKLEGRLGA